MWNIYRTNGYPNRPSEARDSRRCGKIRRFLRVLGHGQTHQHGRQGNRFDRGDGHLSRLRTRWPLYLAAQDPADQSLRVRLPLLRQPQEFERRAGAVHAAGSRRSHAVLLPAQLHRGAVPVLGHREELEPHDGTAGGSRPYPAGRTRFSRVYPSQDHSRGRCRDRPPGGALCGPRIDQCRTADRQRPHPARARQGCAADRRRDGPGQERHKRTERRQKALQARTALRPRGPVDADDRRRRCRHRCGYCRQGEPAV